MLHDSDKPFKILSIDGGGIRGIYPAKFLSEIEYQLEQEGKDSQLNKYFDLICGTSTGGIIAVGLALGMRSQNILKLYKNHADLIFGNERNWLDSIFRPSYDNKPLLRLLRNAFSTCSGRVDPKIGHSKTRLCIPIFNAEQGQVSVIKTSHHKDLRRDYQYPAADVALSTASAPIYFKPHSFKYHDHHSGQTKEVVNNIDAGIFANNPTFIGLIEAIKTLDIPIEKLKILSLGTGQKKFKEKKKNNDWGFKYWLFPKKRLVDLASTSQADDISNVIKFFNQGVGEGNNSKFLYERVQFDFKENMQVDLDETDGRKLRHLENQALRDYESRGLKIKSNFCDQLITPYKPYYNLQ